MLDDPVVAIHQRDPRIEIRHHHIAILPVIKMAWHVRALDKIDVLPFESESLDTFVSSVRHDKNRLFASASIHDETVRATYFASLVPQAAKSPYVLTLAVVLVYVAGAIAIADVDVAIRCDGEIGWAVLGLLTVHARLIGVGVIRIADSPNWLALERGLDHDRAFFVTKIEKLFTTLLLYMEAVRAPRNPAPTRMNFPSASKTTIALWLWLSLFTV